MEANVNKQFSITNIKKNFESFLYTEIIITGRISAIRKMKSSFFVDLLDKGDVIQLYFKSFKDVKDNYLNSGDYITIKGECFLTKTNEPSVLVNNIKIINRWKASVGYKELQYLKEDPLLAFSREAYKKNLVAYNLRNYIKDFLRINDFLEVQTPIYCKNFNGGRSFPVKSFYLNKFIAFNRSTMEERMQALIGEGFNKIFQINSIFRSEKELTFLEAYVAYLSWEEGKDLIKELIQSVLNNFNNINLLKESNCTIDLLINKKWIDLDFIQETEKIYGAEVLTYINQPNEFLSFLKKKEGKNISSLEASVDYISQKIANKYGKPVMINGFPEWNSPLYLSYVYKGYNLIKRTKAFLPGQQGGFDLGIQENDFDNFKTKIINQRKRWGLEKKDLRVGDSDLSRVISAGLPQIFGFGINPDRLLEFLDVKKGSIDPFK